jgi:hypothetical protein
MLMCCVVLSYYVHCHYVHSFMFHILLTVLVMFALYPDVLVLCSS